MLLKYADSHTLIRFCLEEEEQAVVQTDAAVVDEIAIYLTNLGNYYSIPKRYVNAESI